MGFGRNGVEWDLWGGGRGGWPGFGVGQEPLGPSCSGHGIIKARGLDNHTQSASGSSAALLLQLVCGYQMDSHRPYCTTNKHMNSDLLLPSIITFTTKKLLACHRGFDSL